MGRLKGQIYGVKPGKTTHLDQLASTLLTEENISRKQNKISQLCRILDASAYFLWICIVLMEAANQVAAYINL